MSSALPGVTGSAAAPALPASWRTALAEIPERYRSYYEEAARSIQQRVNQSSKPDAQPIERAAAAEASGLSIIQYGAYLPYHLIAESDAEAATKFLKAKGPAALLARMNVRYAEADTLMVIGDNTSADAVCAAVDAQLAERPARVVVAGPGPNLDAIIRSHLMDAGVPRFFARGSADGGACWGAPAGDALENSVRRFLKQHQPARLLVVEPVRSAAARVALDLALEMKLPCSYVEAQRLATPAPTPA